MEVAGSFRDLRAVRMSYISQGRRRDRGGLVDENEFTEPRKRGCLSR